MIQQASSCTFIGSGQLERCYLDTNVRQWLLPLSPSVFIPLGVCVGPIAAILVLIYTAALLYPRSFYRSHSAFRNPVCFCFEHILLPEPACYGLLSFSSRLLWDAR